ncbi:hypothetical protein [Sphingomonas rubra]|uniref:Uncharacterized protein n=1 Tax=Sphingomonas rubra TaxID=634430 RepID=A0A1I5TS18_9SPHN|nr:hypothetical protein [Sphingomonas rubra]SFP85835.1 hypothetical protein SAMN04488241_1099 [Sphingomonas rubra]
MSETAAALLQIRDLLDEAILWAEANGDTLLAVRLAEAHHCVEERIDGNTDTA